jgi:CheY-like chemotaxis protein
MSLTRRTDPPDARQPLVYAVDDEPVLLDFAEVALQVAGFRVRKFNDPQIALETFLSARTKPVLLVTDYAMGKMNGLELIEKCKQAQPALKAILVSGTAGAEILLQAPVQVERYLSKPYAAETLAEAARKVLAG